MSLEEKARNLILAFVRAEQFGKFFTEGEIIGTICERYPFFNEEERVSSALNQLIKENYLVKTKGFVTSNSLRRVIKNWIDFR